MIKLLHIGLSAACTPKNGLQTAFAKYFEYIDINTSHVGLNDSVLYMNNKFKPDIIFMQIQRENVITENTVIE